MAKGDVIWFEQYYADVQEALHDQENNTFKMGLADATLTPAANTADPRWGAGGSTDVSANEVTAGGNYAAGGPTLPNPTVSLASGRGVFDSDDVAIAQDGANPTDSRWGFVYNDTDAGKRCLFAVDLGSATDLSAGAFDVAWDVNGISRLGVAA